jgi:NTE family protein
MRSSPLRLADYDLALVLSGGAALGAYQAGAYQALHEAGLLPGHFAGSSIGAIKGALIAGNRPGDRVQRLRRFWDTVAEPVAGLPAVLPGRLSRAQAHLAALRARLLGRPGLYARSSSKRPPRSGPGAAPGSTISGR